MVYLYAALGVMMMSGIMAVLEMGLSLTGQSLLLKPADPYQQNLTANAVGARDQQMLNLLHNQGDLDAIGRSLQGSALCQQLLCRISLRGVAGCSGGNTVAQDAGSRLSNLGSCHAWCQTTDVNEPHCLQKKHYVWTTRRPD